MGSYELRRSSPGAGLVELALLLILISAFVTCMTVFFVVRTFVKYEAQRKKLWIALAVCIACCVGSGLAYAMTHSDGSVIGVGIGIAELLISCLVIELKHRDTLLRENVSLIDSVLHSPWWGSEDKPLREQEIESVAA
jgi:glycerol-3-phosphate acyltransferase PlsY